jgi:hypothetical protein
MPTFSEAISAARAEKPALQARALEEHLRTFGPSQSFADEVHLRRSFPLVRPYEFDCIVERAREHKSRARRTQ